MGMRTNPYYLSEEQRRPLPPHQQRRLYDDVPLAEENAGAMLKENIRDNRDIELRQKEQRAATEQENIKEAGREQGRMITGISEGYQTGRNNAVARKLSEEQIRGKQFENRMNEGYGEQERQSGLDLTRANVTNAQAQAKFAERREAAGVRGAEAGATTAEVEAEHAGTKVKQQITYQETLNDKAKAETALAQLSKEERQAEMDYQRSDASAIGLVGAKEGESVRNWIMRTDVEMKQTDAKSRGQELAIKEQQLKEAIANAPLNRKLIQSQIAGNYVSAEGQSLANQNAKLDYTGKVKQARLTDVGQILRSQDPRSIAKLKAYSPEEVAEAVHKNKMNDQQSAFLANELKKQDPEYVSKIENRRQALADANNYQNIIGDLQVMEQTYKQDSSAIWDSAAAENDRDKIADYFESAGEKGLAQQVRDGWSPGNQTSVRAAISKGISRIRAQANKRLSAHADSEGVRASLQAIGFTPYANGSGQMRDTGTFDPFSAPVPQWNQPPAPAPQGGAFPQYIQTQGVGPGQAAPPAPAPRKSMRPQSSVRK